MDILGPLKASAILLLLFFGFVVFVFCIAMLVRIWRHADPELRAHANRVSDLVKKARAGDPEAQRACREEPYVRIFKDGKNITRYEIRSTIIFHVFGIY